VQIRPRQTPMWSLALLFVPAATERRMALRSRTGTKRPVPLPSFRYWLVQHHPDQQRQRVQSHDITIVDHPEADTRPAVKSPCSRCSPGRLCSRRHPGSGTTEAGRARRWAARGPRQVPAALGAVVCHHHRTAVGSPLGTAHRRTELSDPTVARVSQSEPKAIATTGPV